MVQAYVLIQTEQGKMVEVARQVEEIEGVDEADVVAGPYDVIARVVADEIDAIGKLIVSEVQAVAGVNRTLTCPVVRL
ncbi:MAG TPA: Lrp/AsnC ligand binding domain-containing protein [Acidimicrobiia bacterium]|nr:Lrp/AsnC ligand binding domain-containing protein [Acidimicrobiia bacterium]